MVMPMKILRSNSLREKIIQKLLAVIYKLDNLGNSDAKVNGEENFIRQLADYYQGKDFTMFDIGANVGKYSALMEAAAEDKELVYAFHLFEPVEESFHRLEEVFAAHPGIYMNNCGASDKEEQAIIY